MITPVVFESAVIAVADYLSARLDERDIAVPVINELPRMNRPPRYVLVVQPGGSQANLITDRPRLVTEVVAEYGSAAADLAAVVRALLGACAPGRLGQMWTDRANNVGFAYSPDPDTHMPRYLITTEMWCKGTALT